MEGYELLDDYMNIGYKFIMGDEAAAVQMFGCQCSPQNPNTCLKNSIIVLKLFLLIYLI